MASTTIKSKSYPRLARITSQEHFIPAAFLYDRAAHPEEASAKVMGDSNEVIQVTAFATIGLKVESKDSKVATAIPYKFRTHDPAARRA